MLENEAAGIKTYKPLIEERVVGYLREAVGEDSPVFEKGKKILAMQLRFIFGEVEPPKEKVEFYFGKRERFNRGYESLRSIVPKLANATSSLGDFIMNNYSLGLETKKVLDDSFAKKLEESLEATPPNLGPLHVLIEHSAAEVFLEAVLKK